MPAMPRTCLLIDDDRDDQVIFSMALSRALPDINCRVADSGQEAVSKLANRKEKPDLIFLDLNMPAMDGMECLRRIRSLSDYAAIPVYIYSTSIDSRLRELAGSLGATDCIQKPQRMKELISILKNLFSGSDVQ